MATTDSAPSANIEVVQSFLGALEALDIERALGHLSDDIVYQNVPLPPARGMGQVRSTLAGFGRLATRFEVHMHNIAERDGVVLTERTDIIVGPLVYLDIWVCGTFELRDGKITLWRDYFDLAALSFKMATSPLRWALHGRSGQRR